MESRYKYACLIYDVDENKGKVQGSNDQSDTDLVYKESEIFAANIINYCPAFPLTHF